MQKNQSLSRWFRVAVFNLVLLAFAGMLLRYKIAFALPWVDQKYLLHAHSHFAFSGWITQALMILMVSAVSGIRSVDLSQRYRFVFLLNLVAAYGMLFSFPFGGYYSVSLFFSNLSIVAGVWFAMLMWSDMKGTEKPDTVYYWFRSALLWMILSSAGAFALAYMMMNHIADIKLHLIAEYFFLHFQYNGWFLFACMGVLYSFLPPEIRNQKMFHTAWVLFAGAFLPAYFLSVLWLKLPFIMYLLVAVAAFMQLVGWSILFKRIPVHFITNRAARMLWILASIAFTIKLLLQAGSTIPELSHFAFGYRPVVIGYLHLVLLGVFSLFILGSAFHLDLICLNIRSWTGAVVFVCGVILNEMFLFIQGITAIIGTYLADIQYWLFGATLVILSGALLLFAGCNGRSVFVENS